MVKLVLVFLFSGCLLVPKNSLPPQAAVNTFVRPEIEINLSWVTKVGNTTSANIDVKEFTVPTIALTKVLKRNGFKISQDRVERYTLKIEYDLKTADYIAKNDSMLKGVGMGAWELVSVLTLGIVPFHNKYEQVLSVTITDVISPNSKSFSINTDYDLWFFFFFFPLADVVLPSERIRQFNENILDALLMKVRQEILAHSQQINDA